MDPSLPPRKQASTSCRMSLSGHRSVVIQSPLQTLMAMGFPKHRADKALAATGCRGAQPAVEWLLNHVNDPLIDDGVAREYILYLCPTGQLQEQLELFFAESRTKSGWNGAHNFLPHITLCSFFTAPDEAAGLLINALQHCVEKMKSDLPSSLKLNHYRAQNFLGLYVCEEQNDVLKRLATMFMRECSEFISGDLGPMHVISTCFPWCSSYPVLNPKRIEVEPYLKSLHLTLAYQYEEGNKNLLEDLMEKIDPKAPCTWELRLYSREQRVKGLEVFKVKRAYQPQELDELDLNAGDYLYIAPDSIKGHDNWAEATSWRTGCVGQFPVSYINRTAESNAWTLHKNISLAEGNGHCVGTAGEAGANHGLAVPGEESDNQSQISSMAGSVTESSGSRTSNGSADTLASRPRQLVVSRHAERIDLTFGEGWIPVCFETGHYARKDLNLPKSLPTRANPYEYYKDSPLTTIGLFQASLTGQGLHESGVTFSAAFSSCAFRCVQTCTAMLRELGQESLAISIEPGLFEWMAWYPKQDTPQWMTPSQMKDFGYNINLDYRPLVTTDELTSDRATESSDDYYERSHLVTSSFLSSTSGNVLIVAHAASLDTCTRQLVGKSIRNQRDFVSVVHKIPFCGLSTAEETTQPDGTSKWTLTKPPSLTLQHKDNKRYDWKVLKMEPSLMDS